MLKKIIIKNLDLNYGSLREDMENAQPEGFVEFLIEFFDKKDLDDKIKSKK